MLGGRFIEPCKCVYCTGLLTTTSAPHSEQVNASIDERYGKVLTAPQCVHCAPQTMSVFDNSSIVLLTSPTGTVRIAALVGNDRQVVEVQVHRISVRLSLRSRRFAR